MSGLLQIPVWVGEEETLKDRWHHHPECDSLHITWQSARRDVALPLQQSTAWERFPHFLSILKAIYALFVSSCSAPLITIFLKGQRRLTKLSLVLLAAAVLCQQRAAFPWSWCQSHSGASDFQTEGEIGLFNEVSNGRLFLKGSFTYNW